MSVYGHIHAYTRPCIQHCTPPHKYLCACTDTCSRAHRTTERRARTYVLQCVTARRIVRHGREGYLLSQSCLYEADGDDCLLPAVKWQPFSVADRQHVLRSTPFILLGKRQSMTMVSGLLGNAGAYRSACCVGARCVSSTRGAQALAKPCYVGWCLHYRRWWRVASVRLASSVFTFRNISFLE